MANAMFFLLIVGHPMNILLPAYLYFACFFIVAVLYCAKEKTSSFCEEVFSFANRDVRRDLKVIVLVLAAN